MSRTPHVFRQIRKRLNRSFQFMGTVSEEINFSRLRSVTPHPCMAVLAFEIVFVFRMLFVERTPAIIAWFMTGNVVSGLHIHARTKDWLIYVSVPGPILSRRTTLRCDLV